MNNVPVNVNRLSAEVSDYMKKSAEYKKARKNYRKSLMTGLGGVFVTVILFILALECMTHNSDLLALWVFIGASMLMVAMASIQIIRIGRALALFQVSARELAGEYIENYIKALNNKSVE